MKNTKQINPIRIFKASKFIKKKYDEDLTKIVDAYKEKGYRDARVITDSVWLDKKKNKIAIIILNVIILVVGCTSLSISLSSRL